MAGSKQMHFARIEVLSEAIQQMSSEEEKASGSDEVDCERG